MPTRTGQQRLDAIPAAVERRDEFRRRVGEAAGDAVRCADLMAEAIQMHLDANMLEPVGKSGKATICIEDVMASYCLKTARVAYLAARGSNSSETKEGDS